MLCWLFTFSTFVLAHSLHFNGGTIRWAPVNPYDNSSSITINFIQTYYWTFPDVACKNNVPITTSKYSTQVANVICIADCSYDGGYSNKPINILTDCISSSSAAGVLKSERSVNITLAKDAHFYASYVGSAWRDLNFPTQIGLSWSITSYINLRRRADGSINTPPVANIVSPQFAIVNRSTQIEIPVSDANPGDHVRCRWSRYIDGYRRRRRTSQIELDRMELLRKKRLIVSTADCNSSCLEDCPCNETSCLGTTCSGQTCGTSPSCSVDYTSMPTVPDANTEPDDYTNGDATTEDYTTMTTTTTSTTLRTTSSFPNRQPVDECGGICYPNTVPANTTLSNCILSFRGLVPNTWYAVALQVPTLRRISIRAPVSLLFFAFVPDRRLS